MANARPGDGRFRLNVGHRPATTPGHDGDRRGAGAAARVDLDVASVHVACAESIDRAQGVQGPLTQTDSMLSGAIRPGIGGDDALAVRTKDNEVACLEARQERPDHAL